MLRHASANAEHAEGVLAAIGHDRITSEDMEQHLKNFPSALREQFSTSEGREHLLKELVRIEVFSRKGRTLGLDQSERFKAKRDAVAKALLAEEYSRQEVLSGITVDDPETRRYDAEHVMEFTEPERVKAQARDIVSRLRQGEEFGSLAERFSERSYQENSDYFARGRIIPEVEASVLGLQVGEISPALKVDEDLLIFNLEDKISAWVMPCEELRNEVFERLWAERRRSDFEVVERRLFDKYQLVFAAQGSLNPIQPNHAAKQEQVTTIIGRIVAISRPDVGLQGQGRIWKIMVEEHGEDKTSFGRAAATVSSDTGMFLQQGQNENPAALELLDIGQWVEIELAGPVAAKYPVQAEARKVLILERSR
jgi:hypothetical protein